VSRPVLSPMHKNVFLTFMLRTGGHYKRKVRVPYAEDVIPDTTRWYEGAGRPGCIASVDGVHTLHGCPVGSFSFCDFCTKNIPPEEQHVQRFLYLQSLLFRQKKNPETRRKFYKTKFCQNLLHFALHRP